MWLNKCFFFVCAFVVFCNCIQSIKFNWSFERISFVLLYLFLLKRRNSPIDQVYLLLLLLLLHLFHLFWVDAQLYVYLENVMVNTQLEENMLFYLVSLADTIEKKDNTACFDVLCAYWDIYKITKKTEKDNI